MAPLHLASASQYTVLAHPLGSLSIGLHLVLTRPLACNLYPIGHSLSIKRSLLTRSHHNIQQQTSIIFRQLLRLLVVLIVTVNMKTFMKTFMIGMMDGKNNDMLIIRDKESKKTAVFTPPRWGHFRLCLDEVDEHLYRLSQGEDVKYCSHYGAGCHVSLTKDGRRIDLRKWCIPTAETSCKPSKAGITLRRSEWSKLKDAMHKLHHTNSTVSRFTPCFFNKPHNFVGCRRVSKVQSFSANPPVIAYPVDDYYTTATSYTIEA